MKILVCFLPLVFLCQLVFAMDEDVIAQAPKYVTPKATGDVYMEEPFDSDDALDSWTLSKATKDDVDTEIAKYDGEWKIESQKENALDGDLGLVLKSKARHHAISAALDRPFVFDDKPFVMQYEVNFQNGIECGGAYIKLLTESADLNLEKFQDKTPYTIMFGPDKCGEDYKLHFIFRHKNPKTGAFEEKHANKPAGDLKPFYTDKASHLYTLVINPDNSFEVHIDQTEVNSGNLLSDVSPPVNPPAEIEDKDDKKPEDWDERESIPDPEATKPDDWDEEAPAKILDPDAEMPEGWLEEEPLYVDDPDAVRPEDWDDEMDGEWEAPKIDNLKCKDAPGCGPWEPPMISNPAYKGKWRPPMIANPDYRGIWKPRMIPNPDYFEDKEPYKMTSIGAVGFELWSMSEDILFDNILITSDKSVAADYAEKTWKLKNVVRKENEKKKRLLHQLENKKRKKEKRRKSHKQPGFFQGLLNAAEERPWLWIIYVLIVGLPIVILTTVCCGGKKKEADHKKTDEPTPDDPHDDEQETKDEANSAATDNDGGDSQQEDEGAGSQAEDVEEEASGEGKAVTKADLENDDEGTGDDDTGPVRRSPRKRKSRVQD